MTVLFEFLSSDSIENVITSMNYKVDKVTFFGYESLVQQLKKQTVAFLKKYCLVKEVVFHAVSKTDLMSVLKTMSKEIEFERANRSEMYFDITGGESLVLVAFGILSTKYKTPMHMYDIPKNRVIELDEGVENSISTQLPKRDFTLTIDAYASLYGGMINERMHKEMKEISDADQLLDIKNMWEVAIDFDEIWNLFSNFLRLNMIQEGSLEVSCSAREILESLRKNPNIKFNKPRTLNHILDRLAFCGLLTGLRHEDGRYMFRFKNQLVKDYIEDGGSLLEMYVFQNEKKGMNDCKIGVHLDWDGEIHELPGQDVINEIDVITIKGNIPTFISCKSGRMGATQSLHALYELQSVANRFGGKYIQKKLYTMQPMADIYLARAKEMGIQVIVIS